MTPSLRLASLLLPLSCFLLFSSTATAFNITRLLDRYDGFKTFNDLLTQTHLNQDINSRRTITVLAIKDDKVGGVSGKPLDVIKNILRNHVVLDYYDMLKLNNLPKGSAILTTLFQTTGVASQQQGFLNVTKANGEIVFGSAVEDATHDVKLVTSVASQPYNISVLEVSAPIIAPGLDTTPNGQTPAPKKPESPPAPAPHQKKSPPLVESPAELEAPTTDASAEAPAEAPASSPTEADPPVADATPVDKPSAPEKSSADHRFVNSFCMALLLGLVASFFVGM